MLNRKNILITGVSTGLGLALAQEYLSQGDNVYAIGRTLPKQLSNNPRFFFFPYDLNETYMIRNTLDAFVTHHSFDTVILNAGILGDIQTLDESSLEDIKAVMELNVWANKELIDTLALNAQHVKQIVAISSGAAVNGSKGWAAYSLSKASLNMLMNLYSKELPQIHFTALAPGIIDTPMVQHIINTVNEEEFPSAKKLKLGDIQTPKFAAKRLIHLFPKLLKYESGSFLDVRTMA